MDNFHLLQSSSFGDSFDLFWLISDWSIFVLLTLVESFVFYKLRFKLDFSGILTLLLHFSVSVMRVFKHYLGIGSRVYFILSIICNGLIWYSLYYFTIEMLIIKYLITEQPDSYIKKKRQLTFLKFITACILIIFASIFIYRPTIQDQSSVYFKCVLLIPANIQLLIICFFEFLFLRVFITFLRIKENKI